MLVVMPFKELDDFRATLRTPARGEVRAVEKRKQLVLVVDDDENMRASLDLVLLRSYRVKTCANGADGVAAISDDVSVVILDVKMSGMDGFATYHAMREKDADLPIIFYSAYQDVKDPYKIINEFRPFGYITKGEDHMAVLESVAAAVEQRGRAMRHRDILSDLGQIQAHMEAIRSRIAAK